MSSVESVKIKTSTRVMKFEDSDGSIAKMLQAGGSLDNIPREKLIEKCAVEGNIFLLEGGAFVAAAIIGENISRYFNSTYAHIGVGNGTVPERRDQTGLQGTSRFYKRVDEGYPIRNGNVLVFRATFGPDEANFHWYEWTVANGLGDEYVNLNRRVSNLGVKTPGTTWSLQVELVFG